MKVGAENLSTIELLAIILSTGTQGSNVLEIAQELLSIYDGKLDRLFTADVQELSNVKGIGKAKAIQLKAYFELSKRMHLSQLMKGEDYYVKSADDIANYFMPMLRFQKQEYLMCVYLNTRGKLLKTETISIGSIEGSMFYPREILIDEIEKWYGAIPSEEAPRRTANLAFLQNLMEVANKIRLLNTIRFILKFLKFL